MAVRACDVDNSEWESIHDIIFKHAAVQICYNKVVFEATTVNQTRKQNVPASALFRVDKMPVVETL